MSVKIKNYIFVVILVKILNSLVLKAK